VRCLFCRKNIGPIRQLRDLEFCSEAHREEFRERFRQRVFEDLAPEPQPSRLADFRERRASRKKGPEPRTGFAPLVKSTPAARQPAVSAEARRPAAYRPTFMLGGAVPDSSPTWNDSTLAYRAADSSAPFAAAVRTGAQWTEARERISLAAQPPSQATNSLFSRIFRHNAPRLRQLRLADSVRRASLGSVGMRVPQLSPENTAVQLAATSDLARPATPPMLAVALPEAVKQLSPPSVGMRVPQFAFSAGIPQTDIHALATPLRGASVTLPSSAGITAPQTPAAQPALAADLSPVAVTPLPRHELAHARLPVALETAGLGKLGVVSPQPPDQAQAAAIAPCAIANAAPRLPELSPALAVNRVQPALPGLEITFRAGEQIERATERPLGLAPILRSVDPQAAGVPASPAWQAVPAHAVQSDPRIQCSATPAGPGSDLMPAANPAIVAASGNQNPRQVLAQAPNREARLATPRMCTDVPQAVGSAAPREVAPVRPAAPAAAAPAWDSSRVAQRQDQPLVPLPNAALPQVDCLPSLAGALDAPGRPWYPGVGRSPRGCAVLWTLSVGHLASPEFNPHPVRVKFHDLIAEGGPYGRDASDPYPRKSKVRVITSARKPWQPKRPSWQVIGGVAAAAALLLAGIFRPPVSFKSSAAVTPKANHSVRQWVTAHAQRDFADDFRGGLDQWKGGPASGPKGWSYSADGFVHPGQLALYRPSVPLSDYRFEFMAQIDTKSVDWVVRAQDPQNYYAVKFTVLEPGPRPLVAMVHYPVIDGARGSRVLTPLRMMIHANTPYRVTMEVKGNRYRTFIEDQEADFWTDNHFKAGGVGFFSEAGERARVYWVKLESHGDLLGRICGLLSGGGSQDSTSKENEAWITGIQIAMTRPVVWNSRRER
jgi:hypothetical protein